MKSLLIGLAAALAVAIPFAGSAVAAPPAPDVPSTIAVPAGHKPFLSGYAEGVQIYGCNGAGWALIAPRANVYDKHGKLLMTHYAGPSWQTKDGSTVVGRRAADPVTVDPTAIPWLLIEPTSATPGRLGRTTYIQRIATTGGLAPAAGTCTAETTGEQREIPYTAVYVFWKARG
jgi:hypothetical protein